MKIEQNEIASVEPFGILNGKVINLTRLKGGLNMATMLDSKGEQTVLGVASHQAILAYTLEQRFSDFQPMIMKSEHETSQTESHSHFLSEDLRKSGYDIYSVQNGISVDFYLTKQNVRVGLAKADIENNVLLIKSLDVSKEYLSAMSSAVAEKALCAGLKDVKVK